MVCIRTQSCSEWEFVASMSGRVPWQDCRGPVITIGFYPRRLDRIEEIVASRSASDVLWSGHTPGTGTENHFNLCAGHWIDLMTLIFVRAHQHERPDFLDEAKALLAEVCAGARWDPKEISNSLAWQRTRLT